MNSGDIIEDRGDIYGEGVNVAARASLDLRPNDVDPMLMMAAPLVASGKTQEAKKTGHRILFLQPNFNLDAFASTQPYREEDRLNRLLDRLARAGL